MNMNEWDYPGRDILISYNELLFVLEFPCFLEFRILLFETLGIADFYGWRGPFSGFYNVKAGILALFQWLFRAAFWRFIEHLQISVNSWKFRK
jgi:hypothetical protein